MADKNRVKHIELKPGMRVDELVKEMDSCGVFSAGRVAKAVEIYREMLRVKSTIFMGVGGAMIPGGLRCVLTQAIREGLVNAMVVTGANATHDLIEAFGGHHARGEESVDDVKLRSDGISRIFDVYVPQSVFEIFEDKIQPMLAKVVKKGLRMSSAEFLRRIGSHLTDENSFLKAAADKKVPIFCPAVADSILGIQSWLFSQDHDIIIDTLKDVKEMFELASDAKKPGAVLLGGGVPKNFIFQSMLLTPHSFDYAIQITMDRPEPGGLSGATLDEAKSWGKVGKKAKTVTIIGDTTVILPIILAAVLRKP